MVMTNTSRADSRPERYINSCIAIQASNRKSYRGRNGIWTTFDRSKAKKMNAGKKHDSTFFTPKSVNSAIESLPVVVFSE